jgi:hypothetical protein
MVVLVSALAGARALGDDRPEPQPADGLEVFRREVRPVLAGTCVTCHTAPSAKGGLDLSRRGAALRGGESGPAIEPGRPDDSLLLDKLVAGDMPPKRPLAPAQIAAFRAWIGAGAPFEGEPLEPPRAGAGWWSLLPIVRPPIPADGDPEFCRNPIDRLIASRLGGARLRPAPQADRATLIRRLCFDLVGLPPTPEDVEAFIHDNSPTAYERLVDRLLASPRYGERWARHWLDVVRFGESHGYEMNQPRPGAWPYRDYVIRAFNRDVPFDRFVAAQLAGEAAPVGDWLDAAATGFLVGGAHDAVGNATVEGQLQQRADDLDDMVATTSTAFLGLTVGCARCHDHKFDPITQRDYYGMQAVFAGVQHGERPVPAPDQERRRVLAAALRTELAGVDRELDEAEPLAAPQAKRTLRPAVDPRRNVERFLPTPARYVRVTIEATNDGNQPCIDELEVWTAEAETRNVALAESGAKASASSEYPGAAIHKIEHLNDGRYGNGRSWISNESGAGWAQVELAEAVTIDRIVWGRDRDLVYRDRLPVRYQLDVATTAGHWLTVASSLDRRPFEVTEAGTLLPLSEPAQRRKSLLNQLAALESDLKIYAGTFGEPGSTHLLIRGDPMRAADAVAPAGVALVPPRLELPPVMPERERRLALARWISDPANPLPPRVMVNRLWHYHFGQGIVDTPSDFGFGGGRPTHPELLDWLAAEFLADGGRMKPIHRLLVLSAAYRRSSSVGDKALAADRSNRLLWRMSPRRLDAEVIRDAILAVAGTLDARMGGPGYSIWEPNTNYVAVYTPRSDVGPDTFRRMIYQFKPRSRPDPVFGAFDCPDAGLIAPRRNVSTTALQALNLLNSRFVVVQADAFAARLEREAGGRPENQVGRAFRLAFGRAPTPPEAAAALALIERAGVSALCRALFNANEFLYVP